MPENVRDRDELLLNAIITGDTSGIDPRDREETFIKAIAEKIAHLPVLTKVGTVVVNPTQVTIDANTTLVVDGRFTVTPEPGYSFSNNRIPITDILVFKGCSSMYSSQILFERFVFRENTTYHRYEASYKLSNASASAVTLSTSIYNFTFDIYRLI